MKETWLTKILHQWFLFTICHQSACSYFFHENLIQSNFFWHLIVWLQCDSSEAQCIIIMNNIIIVMIQQLESQCFEEHTGIFVLLIHCGFKIWEYLDETREKYFPESNQQSRHKIFKKVLRQVMWYTLWYIFQAKLRGWMCESV